MGPLEILILVIVLILGPAALIVGVVAWASACREKQRAHRQRLDDRLAAIEKQLQQIEQRLSEYE